ncbi:hypothetical protein [Blastococcus saxobsidens]|uniref:Uncharacterized protein n=1 Tax=Blastococcus saxobsidens (strain DD2) TaxID=1146883 RepID=H6RUA1_BLASD|nr:hypothetical protein [Blastococcus saxobsidens]CCG05708.1 conserved protein of unknown function [Blastococcus saxobsidens DD2]
MPYTLTSAATLGFDLVRRPAGRRVAEVMLTALAADGDLLHRLADAHPGSGPAYAVDTRRSREVAADVPHVGAVPPQPARMPGTSSALVRYLTDSTIGTAAAVERLLRADILGPEHLAAAATDDRVRERAADVLADAAIDMLPACVHHRLTAPLDAVTASCGHGWPDVGPASAHLTTLFTTVAGLRTEERHRWRHAVDLGRAQRRPWAEAMHTACWAAHLSGRTRALAGAQLLAVVAFGHEGLSAADAGYGVWNALSGCVQGLALADLLDQTTLDTLTAPRQCATGRALPPAA